MRYFFFFACFLIFTGTPALSHAGILEFLFPALRQEEYNPYKEMKAPFASGDASEIENAPVDLSIPHRTDAEIREWIGMEISNLMTFKAGQNPDAGTADLLSPSGQSEYQAFLQSASFIEVLNEKNHDITTVIQNVPILLNAGAVSDRYRWLYEVPVMTTFKPRGAANYEGIEPVNRYYKIVVQVGRISAESDKNPHGIAIETWAGESITGS